MNKFKHYANRLPLRDLHGLNKSRSDVHGLNKSRSDVRCKERGVSVPCGNKEFYERGHLTLLSMRKLCLINTIFQPFVA